MCNPTNGAPGNERAPFPPMECPGCDRPCARFAELGKIIAALDQQSNHPEGAGHEKQH